MLLDLPAPTFNNTISAGVLIQCLIAIVGLVVFMSKKVQRTDSDAETIKALGAALTLQGQTQAQLSATVSLQQQALEQNRRDSERTERENQKRHDEHNERMEKMERNHDLRLRELERVVFVPNSGLTRDKH